jgi:hypothetical protein
VALAAYLVYEERVGRTLESRKGDAPIDEQGNSLQEDEKPNASKKTGLKRLLGPVLFVAAVLFWLAAPAVLLTPFSATQKAWMSSALLVLGEVAFWTAALVLGREIFRRYRRFLNPRDWLGGKRR